MWGRAAPPHPGIYRVPPPPPRPQTDYPDSVTVASVVNPNFYQRQNLPQFGYKK